MRLKRRNRTAEELGIKMSGGITDLFDNQLKGAYRLNDEEFDYMLEKMSDDEMGTFIREEPLTFAQKRGILSILRKYLKLYEDEPKHNRWK